MEKPSESSFLKLLAEAFPNGENPLLKGLAAGNNEEIGIGDDCAYLGKNCFSKGVILGQDMIAEGVHFDLKKASLQDIAFKAIAVNLSDAHSMGGIGVYAVVSVMIPRTFTFLDCQNLVEGFKVVSDELNVKVIGGDTNFWNGDLVICVCIVGDLIAQKPIQQSGMQFQDILLLSGPVGNSYNSGRHLRPKFLPPKILRKLFMEFHINAMTDISDGLPKDLIEMAKKSNCGIRLDASTIPVVMQKNDKFTEGFYHPSTPPKEFLKLISEGEDFQLCLSVSKTTWTKIATCTELKSKLFKIGTVTNKPQVYEIQFQNETLELPNLGFSH